MFFASMEKGKVAETAPLLHNYALAYALGWASSPYYHERQIPQYREHLQALNTQGIYIYPAIPLEVSHRLMQYNTIDETFVLKKEKNIGYPNWGYIKCIRPGARFRTYILSHDELNLPRQIRLGKWMSAASLHPKKVSIQPSQSKSSSHALNVQDLKELPSYFSALYNLLPTRLVQEVGWNEPVAGYLLKDEEKDKQLFLPEAGFWWR